MQLANYIGNFAKNNTKWLCVGLVFLFVVTVRLVGFFSVPLWSDEIFGLALIKSATNIYEIINHLRYTEIYPPLFHILLFYWTSWFGFEEWVTRIPSFAAGIVVIWLGYKLSYRLFANTYQAYFVAVALTVAPILIIYARVVRPYMLMCAVAVGIVLMYWQRRETDRKIFTIYFTVLAIIGLYLHYSFVLVLAPLWLFWGADIFWQRHADRQLRVVEWLMTMFFIFIAFYPWLSVVLYKIELAHFDLYGVGRGMSWLRATFALESGLHNLIWPSRNSMANPLMIFVSLLFKLLLAASAIKFFILRSKKKLELSHSLDVAMLLLSWLVIAPLLLFVCAPMSAAYTKYPEQHILSVLVFMVILFAGLVWQLERRWRWALIILCALSTLSYTILALINPVDWDWRYSIKTSVSIINEQAKNDDLIIVGKAYARPTINYYLNDNLEAVPFLPLAYFGNDELATRLRAGVVENETFLRNTNINMEEHHQKLEALIKIHQPKRVWLIFYEWPDYAHMWFTDHEWRQQKNVEGLDKLINNGILFLYESPSL